MSRPIDLTKMAREFNNADSRYISVRDQANVLSLIETVQAAQRVAPFLPPLHREALDHYLTRFDFGVSA